MGLFDRIKRAITGDSSVAGRPTVPAGPRVAGADATTPKATLATAQNADEILEAIVSYLVENSENKLLVADIDTSVDIFEYGYVDSLRVTKLFEFVEERWGVVVPEAEIVGRLNNLKALAEFIDS